MTTRLLMIVALLAAATMPGSASIILNGGFELPAIGINAASPTSSIPNWTIVGGTGVTLLLSNEYIEGVPGNNDEIYFQTPFGSQFLDLTGVGYVGGLGISQTVNVVAGQRYAINFAVGNVGFGGNTAYCVVPRVGGVCPPGQLVDYYSEAARVRLVVGTTDFGVFQNSMLAGSTTRGVNWEVQPTVYYLATTTGPVNVTFYHDNRADNFAGLDNVSMREAPIPEPATVGMLGLGLVGLGLMRKRARRS